MVRTTARAIAAWPGHKPCMGAAWPGHKPCMGAAWPGQKPCMRATWHLPQSATCACVWQGQQPRLATRAAARAVPCTFTCFFPGAGSATALQWVRPQARSTWCPVISPLPAQPCMDALAGLRLSAASQCWLGRTHTMANALITSRAAFQAGPQPCLCHLLPKPCQPPPVPPSGPITPPVPAATLCLRSVCCQQLWVDALQWLTIIGRLEGRAESAGLCCLLLPCRPS